MHAKRHKNACKETNIYMFHLLSMIKYEIKEFSIHYARSYALTLFILITKYMHTSSTSPSRTADPIRIRSNLIHNTPSEFR